MSAPIPVAVVGCGHLGTYHARLYRELPGAELAAVVDLDPERAARLGAELGVEGTTDLAAVLPRVRAVSVAVPTQVHESVSLVCLEAGCHVLVEKPIAGSVESGRRIVARAEERGRVLAVGHVERFSPAFQAARSELGRPRYVEAHRLAPFVPRSLDVDVVLDLMIHDLDLVLALVESEIEAIDSAGVPVLTEGADIATARIRFRDGTVANLTASRVSREKVRKIRFFGRGRYHSLDLLAAKGERVVLRRLPGGGRVELDLPAPIAPDPVPADAAFDPAAALPPSLSESQGAALLEYLARAGLSLSYGALEVPPRNALLDELADFLGAIEGRPLAGASGAAGLRALELAESVRAGVHESLERLGAEG